MKWIVLFVFWYPACMSTFWIIGSILFYFRVERKKPLPLTETPKVSVLVPCYNEEITIAKTIEELSKLTYPDYEIIAINDGSSDNTFEVLCELQKKYDKLRVVQLETNAGKANALYHGLLASNGEILVGVDADSYLAKDALDYMVPHFTNPKNGERVGAVTGNPRVRNRSSLLAKIQLCEYASIVSMIKRTQRMLGKVMTVSGVIVAFRKRALLSANLWDRDMITEDVAVTWKLEKGFWDVRYEPRALCWMLVPETVKGLWKQRSRWVRGGLEVMGRHVNIFRHWRARRMYPLFLEQVFSILWAFCWLLLFVLGLLRIFHGGSVLPYYWKSQFLSFVCLVQFMVAIWLDKRYDPKLAKYTIWTIWYPILFWYLNAFVVLFTIPKTLLRKKKKYATWDSPDRGLGIEEEQKTMEAAATAEYAYWVVSKAELGAVDTASGTAAAELSAAAEKTADAKLAEASETDGVGSALQEGFATFSGDAAEEERAAVELPHVPESSEETDAHIIDGKQKPWKQVIEAVIMLVGWLYMGVYIVYVVYALIAEALGLPIVSIFWYNSAMLAETKHLFFVLFIVFLISYLILYFWRLYNYHRFGRRDRRRFPPQVSDEEVAEWFHVPVGTVRRMQKEKTIVLKDSVI